MQAREFNAAIIAAERGSEATASVMMIAPTAISICSAKVDGSWQTTHRIPECRNPACGFTITTGGRKNEDCMLIFGTGVNHRRSKVLGGEHPSLH